MFEKLKQFKDLREKAKDIQGMLAEEKITATAAWGKIKMEMNGNQEVLSVTIDPELLSSKEKMENAIKEVTNEAIKKAQKVMAEKMMKDGGFKMPNM
ncbi:MAG TPA: YbaB/EbfC family nucleoid-associated protein [Candidatus Magasanikbacteria bacterium]|nr:YbaB/EbfC family nucleoid-associated protein [Candidatus Magasanikbacteria bacterium]